MIEVLVGVPREDCIFRMSVHVGSYFLVVMCFFRSFGVCSGVFASNYLLFFLGVRSFIYMLGMFVKIFFCAVFWCMVVDVWLWLLV